MSYRKLPAGVQDILPRECRVLNHIKRRLADKFETCGFSPVQSAALDYYDHYADIRNAIPQERLFKMTDTDGKLLVLRPDTTLSISRIAATKLTEDAARLYYFSDKWDFRNAGELTSREVCQAGVECLGEEGAFSDAQTIAFAVECLKEAGLDDFIIDIGHVGYFKGVLQACGLRGEEAEQLRAYVNAKDELNVERLLKSAVKNGGNRNAVSALPALFGGAEVLDKAESLTENAQARSAVAHLKEVNALLVKMGYEKFIYYDLGTVKRLSYYSGIVFSGLVKELGAPVLSGGRYDELADDFGKHIPAVGFAMGLKRIMVALERKGDIPEEIPPVLVACEEGCEAEAYRLFRELTGKGEKTRLCACRGRQAALQTKSDAVLYFVGKNGVEKIC